MIRCLLGGVIASVVVLSTVSGCSSSEEAPPTAFDDFKAKIDGQALAIVPFDLDDPACQYEPDSMSPATLAKCAYLDEASSGYVITDDPRTFDPAPEKKMMLVVYGATIDPERTGWVGVLGLGPLPKNAGPLIETQGAGIGPRFIPLVIGGVYLLDVVAAAGVAYFGARAIVSTAQIVRNQQSQTTTQNTSTLIERKSKLINCTPQEHDLLKKKKSEACDRFENSCLDYAKSNLTSSSYCLGLKLRRQQRQSCLDVRKEVTDKCFGGVTDERHGGQETDVRRQLQECSSKLASDCPGVG